MKELTVELLDTINKFSEKHNLTWNDTKSMLGKIVLDEPLFQKGGIGIIRKGIYVDLTEKRNHLILGSEHWEGEEYKSNELAIVDAQGKIVESIPLTEKDIENAVLIMFHRNSIRFIDLKTMSGGVYRRTIE